MTLAILLFVAMQRLTELWLANRNTKKLFAKGAVEYGASHYKWIVLLHTAWIAYLILNINSFSTIHQGWLAAFVVLQALRVWVIFTLGEYWTTRIIRPQNTPLIKNGPYRFFKHPNYIVVIGEIFALPMVFGDWKAAIGFSILNGVILAIRIQEENLALKFGGSGGN